jgi:solute carrier family 25 phosphate transporter 3
MGQGPFDTNYYLKGALSGGVCCSITHGALCPVDVVKTRIQLDPVKYTGMSQGFKTVIAEEGMGGLATGLGPTCVGYFVQGWFKFGGVEFFKINFTKMLGEQTAWDNKTPIYLASAAIAETIADVFLCPLEAVRIRSVSDPEFCDGLADGFGKVRRASGEEGGGEYTWAAKETGLDHIRSPNARGPSRHTPFAPHTRRSSSPRESVGSTPVSAPSSSSRFPTPWPSSPSREPPPTPSTGPSTPPPATPPPSATSVSPLDPALSPESPPP